MPHQDQHLNRTHYPVLSQRLTGRRARRHRNSRRRWLHRTIGNRVTVSGWGFRRAASSGSRRVPRFGIRPRRSLRRSWCGTCWLACPVPATWTRVAALAEGAAGHGACCPGVPGREWQSGGKLAGRVLTQVSGPCQGCPAMAGMSRIPSTLPRRVQALPGLATGHPPPTVSAREGLGGLSMRSLVCRAVVAAGAVVVVLGTGVGVASAGSAPLLAFSPVPFDYQQVTVGQKPSTVFTLKTPAGRRAAR